MKKQDTIICIWDEYYKDSRIQDLIKDFGGILVTGQNGVEAAKNHPSINNLYALYYQSITPSDSKLYIGEYGTNRQIFPDISDNKKESVFADESSPYRMKFIPTWIKHIGYSSYRTTLFTIPTNETDINIRLPLLSPIFTLKRLNKIYGTRHGWIWMDLKLNLNFCYFRKTFINPDDEAKGIKKWYAKPFLKIPFDWHIKAMKRFAEKYNKKVFIYAGDYDVTKEELLEGLWIIDKYFE